MQNQFDFYSALEKLLGSVKRLPSVETQDLSNCFGRVLAANLVSDNNIPAFNNSQVDGYAFRFSDFIEDKFYNVSQRIPAGSTSTALQPNTVARIFTGAELPVGADSVIMQEDTENNEKKGIKLKKKMRLGENIREKGCDLKSGEVFANICKIELSSQNETHDYRYHEEKTSSLNNYDVVLMRQDPPFNMSYITATHILEKLSSSVLVVNNPYEVRNAPEKIFVTNFSHLMPKTLISRNPKIIKNFRDEYKDIIIKPLYGNGGQGVFHVLPNDENFNSILEMFFTQNSEPLMIQEYLSDVRSGDKRIILVNGEVVGAINRIPKKGESRSNMHVGGKPEKTELTERDKFICNEISSALIKKELYFVGIDIIGDYITEINVTSPTGIREIKNLESIAIEEMFWDFVENKMEVKDLTYHSS